MEKLYEVINFQKQTVFTVYINNQGKIVYDADELQKTKEMDSSKLINIVHTTTLLTELGIPLIIAYGVVAKETYGYKTGSIDSENSYIVETVDQGIECILATEKSEYLVFATLGTPKVKPELFPKLVGYKETKEVGILAGTTFMPIDKEHLESFKMFKEVVLTENAWVEMNYIQLLRYEQIKVIAGYINTIGAKHGIVEINNETYSIFVNENEHIKPNLAEARQLMLTELGV